MRRFPYSHFLSAFHRSFVFFYISYDRLFVYIFPFLLYTCLNIIRNIIFISVIFNSYYSLFAIVSIVRNTR